MALTTFQHTSALTVDAVVTRAWTLPSSGQAGDCRLMLPLGSPALDTDYLDPDGGSWLTVHDEADGGVWRGIVTSLVYRDGAVEVTANQPHLLLAHLPVGTRTLVGYLASDIVRAALEKAVAALAGWPLSLAGVAETGPFVATYEFANQTVWQVLTDMMALSDGELSIDSDGRMRWGPPQGTAYGSVLSAPGAFREWQYTLDILTSASQVVAGEAGSSYAAVRPNAWPAKVVVDASGAAGVVQAAAEAELARRRATVTLSGSVGRDWFGLREGDIVSVFVPQAGLSGRLVTARIIARTLSDGSDRMPLTLAWMPEIEVGARTAPAPRRDRRRTLVRELARISGRDTPAYTRSG